MLTITDKVARRLSRRGVIVMSRRAWGSKVPALYRERRRLTAAGNWPGFKLKVDTIFQHITVTEDSGELTGDFKTDMQTVERIGVQRFNSGVSYNFVVDMKTGMVGIGQPLDSKGTHTVNDKGIAGLSHDQNLVARAIAVLGVPGDRMSPACEDAIVKIMHTLWEFDLLTEGFDYFPHALVAAKSCPTPAVIERMPQMRLRVAAKIKRHPEGR